MAHSKQLYSYKYCGVMLCIYLLDLYLANLVIYGIFDTIFEFECLTHFGGFH